MVSVRVHQKRLMSKSTSFVLSSPPYHLLRLQQKKFEALKNGIRIGSKDYDFLAYPSSGLV
jgi:hypothetical protein